MTADDPPRLLATSALGRLVQSAREDRSEPRSPAQTWEGIRRGGAIAATSAAIGAPSAWSRTLSRLVAWTSNRT
jgi:hypothetical protein